MTAPVAAFVAVVDIAGAVEPPHPDPDNPITATASNRTNEQFTPEPFTNPPLAMPQAPAAAGSHYLYYSVYQIPKRNANPGRPWNMGRKKADPRTVAERRSQILAGARRCFARYGYAGATVEALEKCCGVTRGTLFKYFPNKKTLLLAVVEQETAKRRSVFDRLAEDIPVYASLRSVLWQAVRMQLRLSQQDPDALRLRLELLRLGETDQTLTAAVRGFEQAQREWRHLLVRRLFEHGLIHPDWSPAQATELLSTVFLGLVTQTSYRFPVALSEGQLSALVAGTLCSVLGECKRG